MNGEFNGYRIQRIRLVNFHNIQDATIEVGGHLFLLGDNGSGKTTILDAVQYVLTGGGNLMEFNSAARMAGSRHDGRRVQGIVMRYNVDTGPMNPSGGVSYAALELCDEQDMVLTVGIGLSAYSMEERIQRWGIIISSPLESVPWLTEEDGRTRVTQQREMRDALLSKGAFYTIGAYEKELARRVFKNEEIFAETCRFLSMGKAYREIASTAADYHELFKKLLPEPKTDLFDRIIDSLKTLDESTALLEDMEKKLEYLAALEFQVKTVGEQRENMARYEWLKVYFERITLEKRMRDIETERKTTEKKLIDTNRRVASCDDERVALQRRIDDLRSTDDAGLIRQEKDRKLDVISSEKKLELLGRQLTESTAAAKEAQTRCDTLRDNLLAAIAAVCEALDGASRYALQRCEERIVRFRSVAQSPETIGEVELLNVDTIIAGVEEHIRTHHRERDRLDDRLKESETEYAAQVNERDTLLKTDTIRPEIAGLDEVLSALNEAGIEARLLYEQLEWSDQIDADTRSSIEECIGTDVLSIIMIPEKDYDQASKIVFSTASGIRIRRIGELSGEVSDWIRSSFDLRVSHPQAIVTLAWEMIAHDAPSVQDADENSVLSFRAHRRRLSGERSRWIGQEERKRAFEQRISELNSRIEELEKECTRIRGKIDTCNRNIRMAQNIQEKLVLSFRSFTSVSGHFERTRQEYTFKEAARKQDQRLHDECRNNHNQLTARYQTLLELIQRKGLADLERRIGLLDDELRQLEETYRDFIREEGALQLRRNELDDERSTCEQRYREHGEKLLTIENSVKTMISPEITDISHYILRTKLGAAFKNADSIESAIRDAQRRESTAIGALNEKLRDPVFGALYGFGYNEDDNLLTDRRERLIGELAASERAAIDEQRQVINEKTAELFKKIIVNEMVTFFARHLSRLEQMVRTINDLLSLRTFGTTRYRLELKKEERFAPFIDAVRKFNPFSSGSGEALRQFIDDHRDEIINSEIESIPPILDYRNWYTYHLRMFTTDDEGIIIDRRTRSVGSGGEQAVPNYLTILTIAHFLFKGNAIRLCSLLFDEAFYGIDASRRDQLLGFASDIGLQLLVASPDQDGVRKEVPRSTTILVVKDAAYDVHLYPFHWDNPSEKQIDLFDEPEDEGAAAAFGDELESTARGS